LQTAVPLLTLSCPSIPNNPKKRNQKTETENGSSCKTGQNAHWPAEEEKCSSKEPANPLSEMVPPVKKDLKFSKKTVMNNPVPIFPPKEECHKRWK
jgi:hypothetical protein